MDRGPSFSGSWLGQQRRRLAARVLGAVLAVLAASPFTAPFSACRLSALVGAVARDTALAPQSSRAFTASAAADRGYPTQSMVEEHFKDDAIAQQSWIVDDADGVFLVIVSLRVSQHTTHVTPPVLRI